MKKSEIIKLYISDLKSLTKGNSEACNCRIIDLEDELEKDSEKKNNKRKIKPLCTFGGLCNGNHGGTNICYDKDWACKYAKIDE